VPLTLAPWFQFCRRVPASIKTHCVGFFLAQPSLHLHAVLERDAAPIARFVVLAYGRCSDQIPGRDFKPLVLTIARKPDGMPVAIGILPMRLHSDETAKRPPSPEVVELGKALLSGYKLRRSSNRPRVRTTS
jgi:hypothetical protein